MIHALEVVGGIVGIAVVFAGAYALWRGGGGTALDTLQLANRVLETRVHDLSKEVALLRAENAALAAKTDFALALAPIMVWAESHERNAEKRSAAMLDVLGMLAATLGPDANGGAG